MNSIFPDEVNEAAGSMGGGFVKAGEFEGNGLTVQLAEKMEVITASNPKYGATEIDYLVKKGILEVGQSLRFIFKDAQGNTRKFDTKSAPFFIALSQVQGLEVGDWVNITRTGSLSDTRYSAMRSTTPKSVGVVSPGKVVRDGIEYPTEPSQEIPF